MRASQRREDINARVRVAGRKLFLSGALAELCESEATLKQAEFMMQSLEQEVALREENKKKRLIRRADFPAVKSFADYDYSHITIPPALTKRSWNRQPLCRHIRTWYFTDR